MKKVIHFYPKYTSAGPSSRYRTYQYLSFFEQDFTIFVYPLFDDKHLQRFYSNKKNNLVFIFKYIKRLFFMINSYFKADIIFLEKEFFPYLPFLFEKWVYRKKKVILDYDDAIFHNYDSGNFFKVIMLKNKISKIAMNATYVIVGSPYLEDWFNKWSKKVLFIPTSIDLLNIQLIKLDKNDRFVFGWLGTPSNFQNLLSIKYQILFFLEQNTNAYFYFMGANIAFIDELKHERIIYYDWSKKAEIDFLNQIDIGIMPLDHKSFNFGKCGFKLIQYMSYKKTTISTGLPANIQINEGCQNYIVTSEDSWYHFFEKAIRNKKLNQIGENNYKSIVNNYSIQSNYKKYINAFRTLTNEI